MEIMCKRCGKDVEKPRIRRVQAVQNNADNLRFTGGNAVENALKSGASPVELNC
jgi:hypothetical protein